VQEIHPNICQWQILGKKTNKEASKEALGNQCYFLDQSWTFPYNFSVFYKDKAGRRLRRTYILTQKKPLQSRAGVHPKKQLGQHFLQDQNLIQKIISLAGFNQNDIVLEIGPGLGALTKPLARCVKQVFAVEKDADLADRLRRNLDQMGLSNVTLINQDILRVDFASFRNPQAAKLQIIGNLPYNISSPLLERLIQNQAQISRAVLMFQLELAQRLQAAPQHREYGSLTVLIQYHARVAPLLMVPKEAFYPQPKVGSMVVEIDFTKPFGEKAEDEAWFKKVVKAAFSHKRKTILNSLQGSLPEFTRDKLNQTLIHCGIEPKQRAEELPIKAFIGLSRALKV
jgi:16S rRNA (adenine1518-N6/adenine1519-N6)-dimethyltransferase